MATRPYVQPVHRKCDQRTAVTAELANEETRLGVQYATVVQAQHGGVSLPAVQKLSGTLGCLGDPADFRFDRSVSDACCST